MAFKILTDQEPITQNVDQEIQAKRFKIIPKEKPSKLKEAGRHIARTGARIGETLLGLPGDIVNAPKNLVKFASEKITGKEHPEIESAFDIARNIFGLGGLKTSSEIREQGKKVSDDYLEPQTKGEEFSDAVVSDFASLAIPVKGKIPFLRSLGVSLGSNAAEKGAELLGAGENTKTATKIGSTFFLSALNPKGAAKYGDKLYKDAKALVPKDAKVPAKNLFRSSEMLKRDLEKGGSAAYKTPALTKVKEIQDKIQKGKGSINVDDLTQFKVDINQAREGLYGDVNLSKNGRGMAKRNLDSTARVVDDALKEYGRFNPEWEKLYRNANEVHGAIANSGKVGKNIARIIKQNPHSTAAALAAEVFLLPKSIPVVGAGYGVFKTGELISSISKSPVLQKYYTELVKAALKDDAADISKYLNKLDAGLKKEEGK